MTLTINGETREFPGALQLDGLLQALGLGGKPVVVELNREAIFPRDYPGVPLKDGDTLELVTLAAGG